MQLRAPQIAVSDLLGILTFNVLTTDSSHSALLQFGAGRLETIERWFFAAELYRHNGTTVTYLVPPNRLC